MAKDTLSLADQAYTEIKTNILNLTYEPGMTLTETFLAEELGMSRNPVRTAIKMLQAEGLIVSDFHKPMTVKEISIQDINDIYQLREVLEGSAFRLIFDSEKEVEYSYRIEEKVVRMCAAAANVYDWEVADAHMHMEIISIYKNSRIDRIYESNLSELIRIGLYSVRNGMKIEATNRNLKKMITYMRNHQFEQAYEILKGDHFTIGKNTALKI